MMRYLVCVAVSVFALTVSARAMSPEERREYLEQLLEILPEVPSFSEWLAETGELPPDFDAFPRNNSLPDPLRQILRPHKACSVSTEASIRFRCGTCAGNAAAIRTANCRPKNLGSGS